MNKETDLFGLLKANGSIAEDTILCRKHLTPENRMAVRDNSEYEITTELCEAGQDIGFECQVCKNQTVVTCSDEVSHPMPDFEQAPKGLIETKPEPKPTIDPRPHPSVKRGRPVGSKNKKKDR
jgi:hypothetical protein